MGQPSGKLPLWEHNKGDLQATPTLDPPNSIDPCQRSKAFLHLKSPRPAQNAEFLLQFPSHWITVGYGQMEAAFYMQIFGSH